MASSTALLLFCLLGVFSPAWCQQQQEEETDVHTEDGEQSGQDDDWEGIPEEERYTVSGLIERANKNAGQALDDPEIIQGDVAVPTGLGNADPCLTRGCKWPRSSDGNIYVPYLISNQYSARERAVIVKGLQSFSQSTCIRFVPKSHHQRDYVHIQSRNGCWSFVGRRGGEQILSLRRGACIYHMVVQHELLHALGFNHEQCRSDRDRHIHIYWQNIYQGFAYAFHRINTNNLGTPYDYSSIMHYGRYAFSSNRQPTIVPYPNPNVAIGRSTQMSANDILRVKRLYGCK
ncbi:low choriolytic enzyme-like [Engraulis encrasicolus]|uniref:low choriolytic enzyme-like n=1 Tax=Engraulis encrasicolus TaxID=184585 RepID=UPI002FD278A4